MKAIQITFDERLLKELDADPEVKRDGRSLVLRRAAYDYLRRKRRRAIADAYRREERRTGARRLGFRGGMARVVSRGEVRTYRFKEPDKRRPVVVLSREEAIEVLTTVLVAPVTSTIRDIPSQVVIGRNEGPIATPRSASITSNAVDRAKLMRRLGRLAPERMREICLALAVASGCA